MSDAGEPDFRNLVAWQLGMDFVELVYARTAIWIDSEQHEIAAQVRSAATSVPASIAKGHGMFSQHEFAHHLRLALGSINEAETLLRFATRLEGGKDKQEDTILDCATKVKGLISELLASLNLSTPNGHC